MKSLFLLLFLCATGYASWAQEKIAFKTVLVDSINSVSSVRPIESIYLQTNKEVFETGEDLWFSALVLNRQSLVPSDLSKILYVELRSDNDDEPIRQEMFELKDGFAHGHFLVPDSLKTADYWLAGFTANSLKHQGAEIKSVRRLAIREDIVPHVLIKVDFSQEDYAPNQEITGKIKLMTPSGGLIKNTKTLVELRQGRKTIERIRAVSDTLGFVSFSFDPKSVLSIEHILVRVDHDGRDVQHSIPVPFKNQHIQLSFLPEGGSVIGGLANTVAFKAVDKSGRPFEIRAATLFENGKPVLNFNTEHAGMGKFSFFANPASRYTVNVVDPPMDSVYQLPKVKKEGIQVRLLSRTDEAFNLGIYKSIGLGTDSAFVMLRQRGKVVWLAEAKLNDVGLRITVPTVDLPMGIVEVGVYTKEFEPLSERLVFVNEQKKLIVETTLDKKQYSIKEKVKLRLKVTDMAGNPMQAVFSMSIVDELYESGFAKNDRMTHFLLNDELKGEIYEPAYYFNSENIKAMEHLDLLMMTQGWRNYEWKVRSLQKDQLNDEIEIYDLTLGQVNMKSLSGRARRENAVEVQLFGGFGALALQADSLGRFYVPPSIFSGGTRIQPKVVGQNFAEVQFTTGFDLTKNQIMVDNFVYSQRGLPETVHRNWGKLPQANAAVRQLDEVEVVANKREQGRIVGRDGSLFHGTSADYVCSYNILNCVNHRNGSKPRADQLYRTNSGLFVRYEAPELIDREIVWTKGYYISPEFYQPNYDEKPNEKVLPDFRNTLLWKSNVVTDENGEIELTFYTSDIRAVFNGHLELLGGNGQFGVHRFEVNVLK